MKKEKKCYVDDSEDINSYMGRRTLGEGVAKGRTAGDSEGIQRKVKC